MSIDELLAGLEASGELARVLNPDGDGEKRTMFLGPDLQELLARPLTGNPAVRRGFLRGDMEAFVKGQLMGVCMTPRKANEGANFGLLSPVRNGTWDLRSVRPKPALRVVGLFASKDVFVGLRWAPRSVGWLERVPLLNARHRNWSAVIAQARADWARMFLGLEPLVKDDPHDIISNCHRV